MMYWQYRADHFGPLSYLLFPTALLSSYHVPFINGSSFPDKETAAELSDCPSLRAVKWQSCENTELCGIKGIL